MLYSCKHVATVGVKGLNGSRITISDNYSQNHRRANGLIIVVVSGDL